MIGMSTEAIKAATSVYLKETGAVAPRPEVVSKKPETVQAPSTPPVEFKEDTFQLSPLALEVAEYTRRVQESPENSDFIRLNALKQAIETGGYPPTLVLEGLIKLTGGALTPLPKEDN